MQDVSKEWLEFLRGQFPAGSRIQTWELDDPRNTLKEAGTLEHIDDEGRFHARQSDGGERILTLGEEMFSVHPPEPSLLKLYMPMTVGFYEPDGWGNWDERDGSWTARKRPAMQMQLPGRSTGQNCRRRRHAASCTTMTGRMA